MDVNWDAVGPGLVNRIGLRMVRSLRLVHDEHGKQQALREIARRIDVPVRHLYRVLRNRVPISMKALVQLERLEIVMPDGEILKGTGLMIRITDKGREHLRKHNATKGLDDG